MSVWSRFQNVVSRPVLEVGPRFVDLTDAATPASRVAVEPLSPGGVVEFAGAGERYLGAWSEINARLASRQTVNVYWATIVVTGATALASWSAVDADVSSRLGGRVGIFAIGLAMLNWTFALWVRNNDAVIGLLSSYCSAFEAPPDAGEDRPGQLTSWHTEDRWIKTARRHRRSSDLAHVLVQVAAVTPAVVVMITRIQEGSIRDAVIFGTTAVVGLSSIFLTAANSWLREKIDRENKPRGRAPNQA